MRGRLLIFSAALRPRHARPASSVTAQQMAELVDDLSILALKRPAAVKVFAELVHRQARPLRRELLR